MPDSESRRLWAVFRAEATEILDQLSELTVSLRARATPVAQDVIQDALRLTHNLKGASSSVGADVISHLAHLLEDSFAALGGASPVPNKTIDGMMQRVLQMQRRLDDIDAEGWGEPQGAPAHAGNELDSHGSSEPTMPEGFGRGPSALRVESERLDRLMAVAGEILQTRAHLRDRSQAIEQLQDELLGLLDASPEIRSRIGWLLRRLDTLVDDSRRDYKSFAALATDISASLRSIRMIPLAVAAPGWRRTVRDAAQRLNKEIDVSVHVGDIEIDKRILDVLYDPVNHLLRNAVDHGIEPRPEREEAGKPRTGAVAIRGEALGSRLRLDVEDDGRGIRVPEVTEHAMRAGVRTAEELALMSEREVVDLLFHPGFSTRGEVSQVSGRGIGLDAVRRHLEQVGGRIDVDLRPDAQGTLFSIHVPVSIMSTPGLLVRVTSEIVAFPIDNVERTARIEAGLVRRSEGTSVVSLGDSDPVRLRWLGSLFGDEQPREENELTIVVVSAGESRIGLIVDEVVGQAELIMKPLPWNVKQIPTVNGAVLLDDGSIALAVDAPALADWALRSTRDDAEEGRRRPVVLVVDDSLSTRTLHKSVLAAAGYSVVLASDGEEAWHLLEEQGADLVVSDVLMPRLDGFELTRRIRAHPRLQQLPVILVTSVGAPEDLERGVSAGANEYITKKLFDQEKFLQIVSTYV